ncbi:MAG: hypothetical protein M3Y04_04400 [Actinomycetota bacterium]|nr:hypothetical protein [Actinomycetota bacterium]
MRSSSDRPTGRVVTSLVAALTALLLVAAAAVTVRTTAGPSTLAFIGGGGRMSAPGADPATTAPAANRGPLSNPVSLDATLAAAGTPVPPGADLYAARLGKDPGGTTYDDYVAGGGALGSAFWPASSIKVLAAVGALEHLGAMGYTGAATVTFADSGESSTVRAIYDAAIRRSSNADYDLLVQIAGVDWLNQEFLTPARGFPVTVIQHSYTVGGMLDSPAISITEAGRAATLPARAATQVAECPAGNCSDLFEMSESVRRVVMNDEIPVADRFRIDRADVAGLTDALHGADGFFAPAIVAVLGPGTTIYSKPGEVLGRDCLDVTFVQTRTGQRYLLSGTVPEDQGGCDTLVALGAQVLRLLTAL